MRRTLLVGAPLLILACLAPKALAETLLVCPDDSIRAALERANAGDRIEITGTHRESLRIPSGVSITGEANASLSWNDGPAITIVDARGVSIDNLAIQGGVSIQGSGAKIKDCTVTGGIGIMIEGDSEVELEQDRVSGVEGSGIRFLGHSKGRAARCEVSNNSAHGILVAGSSAPILEQNTLTSNGGCGLAFQGEAKGDAFGNLCGDNGQHGIMASDSSAPRLTRNTVQGNRHSGILCEGKSNPQIANNSLIRNRRNGIICAGDSTPQITGNIVRGHRGYGILCFGQASPRMDKNRLFNNVMGIGLLVSDPRRITLGENMIEELKAPAKKNIDEQPSRKTVSPLAIQAAISSSIAPPSIPSVLQPPVQEALPDCDVDRDIPRNALANPDACAVVIGIEKYRNLPEARYSSKDAKVFREYLIRMLGVPSDNVLFLNDEQATLGNVRTSIEGKLGAIVEKGRSDVYLYYAGHGAPDLKTGTAYLVPSDGDPNYPSTSCYPLDSVYQALAGLKARSVTVFLDACFSGSSGRSEKVEAILNNARPLLIETKQSAIPPGVSVLAAAGGNQISNVFDAKHHGLFTYYLLKGLRGEAVNDEQALSLESLYLYLKPKVAKEARKLNREQTPVLLGDGERVLRQSEK